MKNLIGRAIRRLGRALIAFGYSVERKSITKIEVSIYTFPSYYDLVTKTDPHYKVREVEHF